MMALPPDEGGRAVFVQQELYGVDEAVQGIDPGVLDEHWGQELEGVIPLERLRVVHYTFLMLGESRVAPKHGRESCCDTFNRDWCSASGTSHHPWEGSCSLFGQKPSAGRVSGLVKSSQPIRK